jgi:hypothetical protein
MYDLSSKKSMTIKYQKLKSCCIEYISVEPGTQKVGVMGYDLDW